VWGDLRSRGREKSHTLAGKNECRALQMPLDTAGDRGEAFDTESGLPDLMAREVSQITW
jgi:hypothetical protein